MATTTIALVIGCLSFLIYEMHAYRDNVQKELTTVAHLLSEATSPALTFDDRQAAAESLAALKGESSVIDAAIYDRQETVFAMYNRTGGSTSIPPRTPELGAIFGADQITLTAPIIFQGDTIGTIYLRSNLEQMMVRLKRYAGIIFLILAARV